MITIRKAMASDLMAMQHCNLSNLAENYQLSLYLYFYSGWPDVSFVAENAQGQVVGYVLSYVKKEEGKDSVGYICSLSVIRSYRRLGIAQRLMGQAHAAMVEGYDVELSTLNVRVSNSAAFNLYKNTLAYEVVKLEKKYYPDGEDAYSMTKRLADKKDKEDTVEKTTARNPLAHYFLLAGAYLSMYVLLSFI